MTDNIPSICGTCSLMEQKTKSTGFKPLDVEIIGRVCSALHDTVIDNVWKRLPDCPFNN